MAQATMRDLTSSMVIMNTTVPMIIVLRPNPTYFAIDQKKVFSQTQTLAGFVYEHWGKTPDNMATRGRIQGKVGHYQDNSDQYAEVDKAILKLEQMYKLDKQRMTDILKIATWKQSGLISGISGLASGAGIKDNFTGQKISSLQTLSNTFILYKFTIYGGFFTNFHWNEDSEHPRTYHYNFNFLVTFNSVDFMTQSLLNNFPEARLANFFKQFYDITRQNQFNASTATKLLKTALF